jgi:hypothetical protein
MTATATHENPLIVPGQKFKGIKQNLDLTQPQNKGCSEYPFGEGVVTVLAVTAPGEQGPGAALMNVRNPNSLSNTRSWEAIWYSFKGSDEIHALATTYFLMGFSRL